MVWSVIRGVALGDEAKKINMCLGFPYLTYFFALKNAYRNIFMVILAFKHR